jgi:O-antigen/teichoic acid export membrane protein
MLGSVHFLMPKICHDFARQGRLDRRRMVGRITAVMTVIMAGFCLAVWLFGGRLLTLLYGNPYRGHDVTLVVLALSVLATALSIGSSNALVAMDRPDLTFKATLLGMVAGLATVVAFAPRFGLTGVATGLLCGHLVDSGIRCSMFIHLTRDRTLPAAGDLALNRPGP